MAIVKRIECFLCKGEADECLLCMDYGWIKMYTGYGAGRLNAPLIELKIKIMAADKDEKIAALEARIVALERADAAESPAVCAVCGFVITGYCAALNAEGKLCCSALCAGAGKDNED